LAGQEPAVILDVPVRSINPFIEEPSFLEIVKKFELLVLLFHGLEPALLFPYRTYRWLSPVPFDPAQHKRTVRIGSIQPHQPLALDLDGLGRGDAVNIEKNGAKLLDVLPGAGEVLDEIVPLVEPVFLMVARGGVLYPPHGATAIFGDVLVGTELVPGKERPDAEIEKQTLGAEDGRGVDLVPAGAASLVVPGKKSSFRVGFVPAIFQKGEQDGTLEDFCEPGLESAAIVAGFPVERLVLELGMEDVAELVEAEDARTQGKVVPRDDVVPVVIEIAAHLLDDLDYASAYANHSPCPLLDSSFHCRGPESTGTAVRF
jgi:hypothetical protein